MGLYPAHLEYHVMDFKQCLILWSVLKFFVSWELTQLWNALDGQVQVVQFLKTLQCYSHHIVCTTLNSLKSKFKEYGSDYIAIFL